MPKIRLTILFLLFLICFLRFLSPVEAKPKNKPQINNLEQKLDYVNINWWKNFNDPYLLDYICSAVKNNHSAKEASWKVEEYRQFVKMSFGKELPSLSVGGTYLGAHWPESIKGVKSNIFAIPFIASYEADIFLKNRDKTKSSQKTYEASKFEEKGIYISLVTDVATIYYNIVKFDKQIALQQELVDIKEEKLKRDNKRFLTGVISAEKLNNSQKEYENQKANLEELLKSREKSLTQLALLTGNSPDNINSFQRKPLDEFEFLGVVPDSVSSDIVFSRPDILAIETKLEKSKIDVRVARKEFLPTFSVTGLYSLSNVGAGSFGSWESTIAGILASASLDLFKGGMKVANLNIYKSRYEQMFEEYKQTDLTALKEVSDSLYIVKKDKEIENIYTKNLNIQQNTFNRYSNKYKNGVISFPDLLTSKEGLINSKQVEVNSKTALIIDYFTLYKVVGGKF